MLSVLGRLGQLINEDGEVISRTVNNNGVDGRFVESVGDIEEARGPNDPPLTQHRQGRQISKQRYAMFGKTVSSAVRLLLITLYCESMRRSAEVSLLKRHRRKNINVIFSGRIY